MRRTFVATVAGRLTGLLSCSCSARESSYVPGRHLRPPRDAYVVALLAAVRRQEAASSKKSAPPPHRRGGWRRTIATLTLRARRCCQFPCVRCQHQSSPGEMGHCRDTCTRWYYVRTSVHTIEIELCRFPRLHLTRMDATSAVKGQFSQASCHSGKRDMERPSSYHGREQLGTQ
ncbi:hypothetical protein BV20DRAFT_779483 [Pilatotrama ljubarskyi]|nr:hypothetical protein BV20DRAFT_779483 [Pilatotrama ljubarskyi]